MKKLNLFKTVAIGLLASVATSSIAQNAPENKSRGIEKRLSEVTQKTIEDDLHNFEKKAFKKKGKGISAVFKGVEQYPEALPSTGDRDYKAMYQFSTPQTDGTEVETTIGFVFKNTGFDGDLESDDAKGAIVMMQNKKDHSYIYMKVYFDNWEEDGKDLNSSNVSGRTGYAYYPDLEKKYKSSQGDSVLAKPDKNHPYVAAHKENFMTKAIMLNFIKKASENYNQTFKEFTEWENRPYKKEFDPNNKDRQLAWNMF